MLSFDSWRACRLVVDTGLHQLGWSRDQAIDYLLANSALTRTNVENEVDRYVAWPGQALAYMVGRLELVRLRRWPRTAWAAGSTCAPSTTWCSAPAGCPCRCWPRWSRDTW